MGEQQQNRNQRNTYLVLITAGVFLLLHNIIRNPGTLIAMFMILLGLYSIRSESQKKGYVLLAIGAFILIGSHFAIIVALLFLSLGFFYIRSKQIQGNVHFFQKTKLIESLKWNKEPWLLKSMSLWYVIGELKFDFTLAIHEEKEATLVLQGIIGDIDIIVPEDLGVQVQGTVFFGQLDVAREKESGIMNKIHWQSPNFETSEHRVKLIVSYIVGDIDIKVM